MKKMILLSASMFLLSNVVFAQMPVRVGAASDVVAKFAYNFPTPLPSDAAVGWLGGGIIVTVGGVTTAAFDAVAEHCLNSGGPYQLQYNPPSESAAPYISCAVPDVS